MVDPRCGSCFLAGSRVGVPGDPLQEARCGACRAPATNRRQQLAVLGLVGTAVLWGSSFAMTKVAVASVPVDVVVFLRCAIGAVILGVACHVGQRRQLRSRPLHPWLAWTALGGAATAASFLLISAAVVHVDSGPAGVAMATVPILTAVAAALLHISGRLATSHVLALALGLAAIGLLALGAPSGWALGGIAMLALAALAHASANISAQLSLRQRDPISTVATSLAVGALVAAPFAAPSLLSMTPEPGALVAIVALGALPTALAYVLYFHGVGVLGAARASLVIFLVPPISVLAGVVSLGERPTLHVLVAMVLALGAVWIGLRPATATPARAPGSVAPAPAAPLPPSVLPATAATAAPAAPAAPAGAAPVGSGPLPGS